MPSSQEALRTWAEWEGKSATGVLTVAQMLARYIDDNQARLAASTVESYRVSMRQLVPVFGSIAVKRSSPSRYQRNSR